MKIIPKSSTLLSAVAILLTLFAISSRSVAEIATVEDEALSNVEGQFIVSALVGAYIVKEIIVGEIIGEAVSVSEDAAAKLNLLDAVRPNNDTGLVGDAVKRSAVVASVGGATVAAVGGMVAGGAVMGSVTAFILGAGSYCHYHNCSHH